MKKILPLSLIIIAVAMVTNCMSADKKEGMKTYTDPANAGPDYKIQGEYVATAEGKHKKVGAQVIALGDGKFRAVIYYGGLPGDGWKRGMKEKKLDRVYITKTSDGKKLALDDGGGNTYSLKKVHRKSPTMGAKPPKGAKVLFDGTSAEHFENGKMTKDKLLEANTFSKLKCGDCKFHLEFRIPFKPKGRGQDRGNSGVYLQSRYECQVLDSFGLEGKNNECGGFYQIQKPAVNMCFPPLTWQTYDIDFTAAKYKDGKKVKNAKVTVKHNGVMIHKDLELPKHTPGRLKEEDKPAPIMYLQGHGNPVVYRNIWVLEK